MMILRYIYTQLLQADTGLQLSAVKLSHFFQKLLIKAGEVNQVHLVEQRAKFQWRELYNLRCIKFWI